MLYWLCEYMYCICKWIGLQGYVKIYLAIHTIWIIIYLVIIVIWIIISFPCIVHFVHSLLQGGKLCCNFLLKLFLKCFHYIPLKEWNRSFSEFWGVYMSHEVIFYHFVINKIISLKKNPYKNNKPYSFQIN